MVTMKRILFLTALCLAMVSTALAQEEKVAVKLADVPHLQELVDTAYVNGDWETAVNLQQKIVAVLEKEPLEKEGKRYSKALCDLAYYEFVKNDFTPDAIAPSLRAKELIEQYHGKDSEQYVAVLNNLIAMYSINQLDSVSEPLRWEVVECTRAVYGPESEEYFNAVQGKASYCAYAKYYDRAIAAQTEAVSLSRALFGDNDQSTIDAIEFLADFYARNGDAEHAVETLKPTIDGADASHRATAINALAQALVDGGQSAKAIELINKEVAAIEEGQMNLDEEIPAPPETIDLLHTLAITYHQQGDTIHRDEALNHALTQSANIDGLNSPGFAQRLMDQTKVCYDIEMYDRALSLSSSAYKLMLSFSENDRQREFDTHVTFLLPLAMLCHKSGDDNRAWQYLQEMADMFKSYQDILEKDEVNYDEAMNIIVSAANEIGFPITTDEFKARIK